MLSSGYFLLIAVTLIIGLGASGYVNSQLKKYSRVGISNGLTGAEAARRMLAFYGIRNVEVHRGGAGQDFFDPRSNSVTLSPEAYDGRTITATATACHEVGHAYQYAEGYAPMKVRGALVPAVNFASNAWIFLLMIGIFMQLAGLQMLAIVLYAVVVLFQVVTLPVEFNASGRAVKVLAASYLPEDEVRGVKAVLSAAALTYVAAALQAVLQLLRLILISGNSRRRD